MVCVLPYKNAHMIALLLAALLRAVFLGRNYTSRLIDKKGILFIVIVGIEVLHFYVINNSFFIHYASEPMHHRAPISPFNNTNTINTTAAPRLAHRVFLATGLNF
jgi:hypothetical protein